MRKICINDNDLSFPERLIVDIVALMTSSDRNEETYRLIAKLLCAYDPAICDHVVSYWNHEKEERLGAFLS